jgi:hypothetical protein
MSANHIARSILYVYIIYNMVYNKSHVSGK